MCGGGIYRLARKYKKSFFPYMLHGGGDYSIFLNSLGLAAAAGRGDEILARR